jgi:hypothetical protein
VAGNVQKAKELAWIREVQASGALPPGAIVEEEPPDALIQSADGTVGVEIVEYVRGQSGEGGSKNRAYESTAEHFARIAKEAYDAKYNTPLWVTFMWGRRLLPRLPKDRQALVAEFAELVAQHIP